MHFADEESEQDNDAVTDIRETTAAALIRQEAEGGALLAGALLDCMSDGESLPI